MKFQHGNQAFWVSYQLIISCYRNASLCIHHTCWVWEASFFVMEYDYAKILEFWNQIFMIMEVFMIFRSIYSLRNYNSLLNLLYYTTINIQRESGRHSKWLYKKSCHEWPWMTMNSEPFIFENTGKTFGDPLVRYKQYGIYSSSLYNLYNYDWIRCTVVEIMNRHVWGYDVLVMKAHRMIKVWN